ncbi:MAG TPA: hypothetical protein VN707_08575 [Casimicrobiaceae bacterium]|nr:hypothetical protein [Casimicrobiaceae bacterium]
MNTLAHPLRTTRVRWRPAPAADDPLAAARGILFGMMLSVLGFWLPLALVLTY